MNLGEVLEILHGLNLIGKNGIGYNRVIEDIIEEEASHKVKCEITHDLSLISLQSAHVRLNQILGNV